MKLIGRVHARLLRAGRSRATLACSLLCVYISCDYLRGVNKFYCIVCSWNNEAVLTSQSKRQTETEATVKFRVIILCATKKKTPYAANATFAIFIEANQICFPGEQCCQQKSTFANGCSAVALLYNSVRGLHTATIRVKKLYGT